MSVGTRQSRGCRWGFSDVTVLDVSNEALRTAEHQVPDPNTVTLGAGRSARVDTGRRWGIWHDRAVFHFLTELHERETYRKLLRDAIGPGT